MMSAGNASAPADQRDFQTRQGRPSETQHQAMRKTEGHYHGAFNGTTDNTLAAGFMSRLPWHFKQRLLQPVMMGTRGRVRGESLLQ